MNDHESTRRSKTTGEFLDMCNKCLTTIDIPSTSRNDLEPNSIPDEDYLIEDGPTMGEDDES